MTDKNKQATCPQCGTKYYIQNMYWDHKSCVKCLSKQMDIYEGIIEVCKTLDKLADVCEYRDMPEATDAIIDALERAMLAKKIICGEGDKKDKT